MAKQRTLQEHQKDVAEAGIDAEELAAKLNLTTEGVIDSGNGRLTEVMQLVTDAVTSDRDGKIFETFMQVIAKLSPSLSERMNATYRKHCEVGSGESCVEDKEGVGGGDGGLDGENHGGGVGAKGSGDVEVNITRVDKMVVGVSYSEAPPPSEGHISSKRVIREDCDESLPPGKRPPLPANGVAEGPAHIWKVAQPANRIGKSYGHSFKGPTPDSAPSKGPTPDSAPFKGPTPDSAPSKGLTSDSLPSEASTLTKEGQPYLVWNVDRLSRGLIGEDTTDGPALSTWQLQDYQINNQLNGEGIVVAIVDSGINIQHAAFRQRIIFVQSFVGGSAEDVIGHGTRCAGIACGAQFEGCVSPTSEEWVGGIAPGAKLVACKVVPDGSTQADLGAVCNALDFIQNYNTQNSEQPINIVSLSFGTPYLNEAICSRVHSIISTGVIVVCAASNDGRLTAQPIAFPARLGHVLCIGSSNSSGKPSSFTAVGREIDFLAPGEDVWAPSAGGPQAMSCGSGTSYAAPAVAGLICLVLQYLRYLSIQMGAPLYQHAHNVWAVRELLKEMATSAGRHSDELGYGSLEPQRFFQKHPEEIKRIVLKMVQ